MRSFSLKKAIYILLSVQIIVMSPSCSHGGDDGSAGGEEASQGHEHEGAVEMSPEEAKKFGVESERLVPGSFTEVIRVTGKIQPAATDRMIVTARKSGILTLAPGVTEGRSVSTGAVIGSVSAKGVQGGDISAAAHASLATAKRELDRITPLYNAGLVTASEYNAALGAYHEASAGIGTSPGVGAVMAPCSGTITEILVSSGQYVEVGAQIATIAKNTRLTLKADVPEKYFSSIPGIVSANFRPDHGDETFSISGMGGHRISGDASSAAVNGYVPLYFSFNSNGKVAPGAYAEVYLLGTVRQGVLSVPRSAIIEMQGNKYVYIVEHGHAYEKRLVETGASDGIRVEILSGVKDGETVVVKGASVVRMKETSAIAPPGHSHNH